MNIILKDLHTVFNMDNSVFQYGMQLHQNFIQPHQKQKTSPMVRWVAGTLTGCILAF